MEQTNKPPPPFSCTCSPNVPELLNQLGCTLMVSTYQAGKISLISAQDDEKLIQLPRTFRRAMALGTDENRIAIATAAEVVVLANEPGLAQNYPKQPNTYDGFFAPRASYYTGRIDIHGLEWGEEGLWAVNTLFSCLALVNDKYSFIPRWKPKFISKLAPEDRCHLNSMAMIDGKPEYATTMGDGNTQESWRKTLPKGGTLIHVPSDEIILNDLPMPHSARFYDGKLYLLFSATGEIVQVDPENQTWDVVNKVDGFVRGMCRYQDYLFICMSKLRKNSSTFKDLPIADKAKQSGITILHLPTGALVGRILYLASVDEIFDIQVIPGLRRPGILNTEEDIYKQALTTPETSFWAAQKKEDSTDNR